MPPRSTAAGAPIDVIHAWQLPAGSWGASLLGQARFPWSTVRDAVLASAKAQADKLVAEHASLGHPLHVELVQGPPASVITHAAERGGHDLIAIGTHGHRGFRRLLLGSVAESTIRHAPCSVLVVHGEHAGDTAKFRKGLAAAFERQRGDLVVFLGRLVGAGKRLLLLGDVRPGLGRRRRGLQVRRPRRRVDLARPSSRR